MWRFCRRFPGWSYYQPSWLPLDYHLGFDSYERHHLHFVLCKQLESNAWKHWLIFAQADSLAVLVIGQAFEGVPWGLFIANSPAYASEVVPLVLRGVCTATLQMSWSIGGIIVAAATLGFNGRMDHWAWKGPLALQWVFPVSTSLRLFSAKANDFRLPS